MCLRVFKKKKIVLPKKKKEEEEFQKKLPMKCGDIDEARNFARANKHRNSFKRTVKHVKSSAAILAVI